jgi:hypothetical protein
MTQLAIRFSSPMMDCLRFQVSWSDYASALNQMGQFAKITMPGTVQSKAPTARARAEDLKYGRNLMDRAELNALVHRLAYSDRLIYEAVMVEVTGEASIASKMATHGATGDRPVGEC